MFGYLCAMCGGTWGAHPSDDSMQSGRGRIGNAYRLRNVAKTVVRARELGKVDMQMSAPPPTCVVDLMHTLITGRHDTLTLCRRALVFALSRLGNLMWTPGGRKYGAVY